VESRPPVNPYIAGSPVTGTEMFYGRDDVFAFIRRKWPGRHRDPPFLLYGQRRTGKTSVLYQMHRHLGPGYRCILIDLHGLDLTGMGNFLLDLANSISWGLQREHQLDVPVPDHDVFLANPRSVFETVFLEAVWSALGTDHLVLMIDEMVRLDEEVRAGRLEREVFEYLRHLMQHYGQLNFVFSLGSSLEEMRRDYALLFSVALYHRISFLEPAAARDLITQPAQDHYQVAPQAVTKIMRITSGHAYYTQLVCHGLFDLWSRSPKPVLTEADVDAVLAAAIELGSANLTYVWEESTPEEKALLAGMAAAMHGEAGSVTLDQAREAWQAVGVSLPGREATRAAHSLTNREVITGNRAHSFTVDLQRLWLEQHRRLEWVKEELPEEVVERWSQSAEVSPAGAIPVPGRTDTAGGRPASGRKSTRLRRYLGIAIAVAVAAGYLVAAAVVGLFPFSPGQSIPQSLIQLLPGDLPHNPHECHVASPPSQWNAPGLTLTVHCTDAGLPRGNVYLYQMDGSDDSVAAWHNFNSWWVFLAQSADSKCPPKVGTQGIQVISTNLPQADQQTLECGEQKVNGRSVPAMALSYPANDAAFVVAQGAPGSSLRALVSWWNRATAFITSGAPNPSPGVAVGPLVELLPSDLDATTAECHAQKPPFNWAMPGLVQALACHDPGLPNGSVYAYQMDTYADYQTTWANYNKWWGFNASTAGSHCPPGNSSNDEGTAPWYDSKIRPHPGQVLECAWAGSNGVYNEPSYTWTFPTENAFIIAQGAANSSFSALDRWWTSNRMPLAAPQSISFTGPASGMVGGSATLSAIGGGSGNPVVLSVDSSSGAGVCTLSGGTVTYATAGSCVIDANQAGNGTYAAAPEVQRTITVKG
jgi:hypothetical protein